MNTRILVAVTAVLVLIGSIAVTASADSTYVNNTVEGKAACLAGNCFQDAAPAPTTEGPCTPGALVMVGGMVTVCPGATVPVATSTTTYSEPSTPTVTTPTVTTVDADDDKIDKDDDDDDDQDKSRRKDRRDRGRRGRGRG